MFLLEGIISSECKILFIPKGMKWQHPSWSGMRIIRLIGPPTVFATSVLWGDGKTKGRTQDIEGQPKESTWKLRLRFPSNFPCSTILERPKKHQKTWPKLNRQRFSEHFKHFFGFPHEFYTLWSRWSLRRLSCLLPQLHASDCCLCPVTELTQKKGRCFKWLKSAAKMVSRNTFLRHVFKKKSWPDMTGHRIHIRFCIVIVPHDVSSYSKQLPKDQPPFPTSRLVLWLIVALDSFHIESLSGSSPTSIIWSLNLWAILFFNKHSPG